MLGKTKNFIPLSLKQIIACIVFKNHFNPQNLIFVFQNLSVWYILKTSFKISKISPSILLRNVFFNEKKKKQVYTHCIGHRFAGCV